MLKKIMLVALIPLLGVCSTTCMDLVEQPKLEIAEDAVDTAAFYAYGKLQAELYKASLSGDKERKLALVESIDTQAQNALREIVAILLNVEASDSDYEDALLAYRSYNQGIYQALENINAGAIYRKRLSQQPSTKGKLEVAFDFAFYNAVFEQARAVTCDQTGSVKNIITAFAERIEKIQESITSGKHPSVN